MNQLRIGQMLRPAVIAPLLCLLYALAVIAHYGDTLALVTIGSDYAPAELRDHAYSAEGYDGQSVYYLARYGWEAAPYLDVPAYRAQRILLPFLGRLVAFSSPDLLVWALFAINLVALAGGTYALEKLLQASRASVWYAAGYAFSAGVFGAARLNTTETLSYALVAVGLYAILQRQNWLVGMIAFGAATLAKEMTLIFPAALIVHQIMQDRTRKIKNLTPPQIQQGFAPPLEPLSQGGAVERGSGGEVKTILIGSIAFLPFILWQLVLYAQFGAFGVGSGGEKATSFELIPLMGVIRIFTEGGAQIFAILAPILLPFVLLPTAWAFWQCWRDARYTLAVRRGEQPASVLRGWDQTTTLLLANAILMLFVPFSTYRELLGILRFIVGLQIAVILYAAQRRQSRALRYSTLWFTTSFIVIISDFARG
jgi:hypothetical protein